MNLFADIRALVLCVPRGDGADGALPQGLCLRRRGGRAAARRRATATWRRTPRWCWPSPPAAKPRDIAEALAARLAADPRIESRRGGGAGLPEPAAGAGRLAGRGRRRARRSGLRPLDPRRRAAKVNVEYVSANPTGPMHVGHTRGAVFGDALAALLEYAGLRGDAGILHQRRRRAGRRARPLGLRALPRGLRRGAGDRRGALSRRLPDPGRRGV